MERSRNKMWLWLAGLAVLSPIGIILPKLFGAEDAWGEWGTDTLIKLLGYIPKGLERTAELWKAPLPDYSLGGMNHLFGEIGSYGASALIGGLLVVLFAYIVGKLFVNRGK
jgi:hypothetical protein